MHDFEISYNPPSPENNFSIGDIKHKIKTKTKEQITSDLECATKVLLNKYNIPLMLSASYYEDFNDEFSDEIVITSYCWLDSAKHEMIFTFDQKEFSRFLKGYSLPIDWRNKFEDYRYFTADELNKNAELALEKMNNSVRLIKGFYFTFFVLMPIISLVVSLFIELPKLLEIITTIWSVGIILYQYLKLRNIIPRSEAEIKSQDIEREKNEYYYYCNKNRDLFNELRYKALNRENKKNS